MICPYSRSPDGTSSSMTCAATVTADGVRQPTRIAPLQTLGSSLDPRRHPSRRSSVDGSSVAEGRAQCSDRAAVTRALAAEPGRAAARPEARTYEQESRGRTASIRFVAQDAAGERGAARRGHGCPCVVRMTGSGPR